MKKFILTIIAVITLGTGAIANSKNGQEPYLGSPYLGIAYSYMNENIDVQQYIDPIGFDFDVKGDSLSIIGGYNFHQFLAVEGRYTKTVGDLDFSVDADGIDDGISWGGNMTNVGVYFKPKHTSTNGVTIYALLGMGHVKLDLDYIGEESSTEFQWGAGISFDGGKGVIGDSDLTLFLDYTRLYDNEHSILLNGQFIKVDDVIDVITVGVAFTF